jgi:DNA-binding winged helix-turn-helix (wHTH) protein
MTDQRERLQITPDSAHRRVRFGPFEADLYTLELWKYGTRMKLGRQPFQVLAMLLSRPGDLVTREELQKQLWPEDTFFDANHGLNAAVNKLRETLNDVAKDPKYIETLPRRGYRFIGSIEHADPARKEESTEPAPTAPDGSPILMPEPPQFPRLGSTSALPRWAGSMPALGVFLAILFTASGLLTFVTKNTSQPAPRREELLSIQARAQQHIQPAEVEATETKVREPRENTDRRIAAQAASVTFEKGPAQPVAPVFRTIIPGGSGNAAPQISPDGKRLAFMSNRSGPWQIWVSDIDGSNPAQLSYTDSAGTPRWSPDGRTIAFDAPSEDGTSIYVVPSNGTGRARCLVEGKVPSFSRDGRWIYFASDQNGNSQVWKIPVSGGPAKQVTTQGGFAALESNDGYLYYSKSPGHNPEICRVRVSEGDENCSLPHLRPRTWSSWAVTRNGILFAEDMENQVSNLSVYEPEKRQVRDLVSLQSAPVWIGASFDGKRAIVNDSAEQQISLVDNLP